jgi:hypothetical protein
LLFHPHLLSCAHIIFPPPQSLEAYFCEMSCLSNGRTEGHFLPLREKFMTRRRGRGFLPLPEDSENLHGVLVFSSSHCHP